MQEIEGTGRFHAAADTRLIFGEAGHGPVIRWTEKFSYDFQNFFHPFVAELIKQLNQTSVAGMLDPDFLAGLHQAYTAADYTPLDSATVSVTAGGSTGHRRLGRAGRTRTTTGSCCTTSR